MVVDEKCSINAILEDKRPEISEKTPKCPFMIEFKAIRNADFLKHRSFLLNYAKKYFGIDLI